MTDLLERLKAAAEQEAEPAMIGLLTEAADEIERLRSDVMLLNHKTGQLTAAVEQFHGLTAVAGKSFREIKQEIKNGL